MSADNKLTLTREGIARRLQDELGSRSEAYDFTQKFFDTLTAAVAGHDKVKIQNFGVFRTAQKPPRPGRNPKTGEPATVEARRVAMFSASRSLNGRLAAHADE